MVGLLLAIEVVVVTVGKSVPSRVVGIQEVAMAASSVAAVHAYGSTVATLHSAALTLRLDLLLLVDSMIQQG